MRYYVGIDLGGTNIVASVVDETFHIHSKAQAKTRGMELPFEQVVKNIASTAREAVAQAGLTMADISSVGMGSPSVIHPKTGLLVHANNMGWRNVPLLEKLQSEFDCPVFIKNDADCAALGEVLAGSARDYENALMITLGTGVGGGIILNKKIFNGCDNMGAELGHTKLVFGGVQCTCGQYGCLESYASATGLIRQTKEAMAQHPDSSMHALAKTPEDVDGQTAFEAARQGDAAAQTVVDRYIAYLAAGLSTFITIFRPDVIILGGGVANQGKALLEPLQEVLYHSTFAAAEIGVPPVIVAELGNDAGVIGAAMLEVSR